MSDTGFDSFPDIPPPPTLVELNDFFVMCAEAMAGQTVENPVLMVLKGAISIVISQSAEIERLRVALGQEPVSFDEAQAVLQDLIDKAQR